MNKWSSLHLVLLGHYMVEDSLGELQSTSFISPGKFPWLPISQVDPEHSTSLLDTHPELPSLRAVPSQSHHISRVFLPYFPLKLHSFNAVRKLVFLACWEELESHIARVWIPGHWGHFCNLQQVTIYRYPHAPGHPRSPASREMLLWKREQGISF